jgi:hypothetical protein
MDPGWHGFIHLCAGAGSGNARFVAGVRIPASAANLGYYGGLLFSVFLIGVGMRIGLGPIADRFVRVRTLT